MKSSELEARTRKWLDNNPDSPLHLLNLKDALTLFEIKQEAWKELKIRRQQLQDERKLAWKLLKKEWKKARRSWKRRPAAHAS